MIYVVFIWIFSFSLVYYDLSVNYEGDLLFDCLVGDLLLGCSLFWAVFFSLEYIGDRKICLSVS